MTRPAVAFYAPMKAPDHPVPSGDRQIARLTLRALECAGFAPHVVSRLRVLDVQGCAEVQSRLMEEAGAEAARLATELKPAPALWFTYHCHYKAPDLLGPAVARRLGIPYAISEPSISPRRRDGPWAAFARASEVAITAADRLFWTTGRDRPGLEARLATAMTA
ncbi:MAG TPA: glycosyltransferase family 1 protein, partial [Paracoccaceae bacterium]|nr:glycosyltransferase family 1 protein [Paracoccaceae bacterium]